MLTHASDRLQYIFPDLHLVIVLSLPFFQEAAFSVFVKLKELHFCMVKCHMLTSFSLLLFPMILVWCKGSLFLWSWFTETVISFWQANHYAMFPGWFVLLHDTCILKPDAITRGCLVFRSLCEYKLQIRVYI